MTAADNQSDRLSLTRLAAIIDAYGAEPDAWPQAEREPALALLERSPRAQQLLAEATALDSLLAAAPTLEPSAELQRRVLAAAPRPRTSWLRRLDEWTAGLWPFSPRWQPAAALVAAATLGVVLGAGWPEDGSSSEPPDVVELAFGTDDDWSNDL